jgi:hypothetical protein
MKKVHFAIVSALALSLVAANTTMAKAPAKQVKDVKHKTGLENALDHVKNPKAREAIKNAMERQKQKTEDSVKTGEQIVAADKSALAIGFSGSDNASFVTSPLTFPAKGANGSQITWVSSAPAIISNDGKTVNRPATGQGDAVVTLTATLTSNDVTDTKVFTLIVKQQLTDADKVAADKAVLAISYTEGDSADSVTSKLTLPTTGVNGSTITWVSNSPTVISDDGKTVTRPLAGQGDATVTLIAAITSNSVSDVKSVTVVVKQQLTDAQKVAADKTALQIEFSGPDTAANVTAKLTLPTIGANGSIIVWYSSNTSVIADNGTVVRPAAGTGDKTVKLTAIIVSNAAVDTKAFTVTIKQLP